MLSSLIAGGLNLLGGYHQAHTSKQIAQMQMDFQEKMANTAVQRHMADLKAAGVNPMLAASSGQGAASPSGSSYVADNYIGKAVNSAIEAKRAKAELMNLKAQNAKIFSEVDLNKAMAHSTATSAKSVEADMLRRMRQEDSTPGRVLYWMQRGGKAVSSWFGR